MATTRVADSHDDRNLDSEARRTLNGFRERQWERRDHLLVRPVR